MNDIFNRFFRVRWVAKIMEKRCGHQTTLTIERIFFSLIATITLSIFLMACNNESKTPEGVLTKAAMTKILTEFYLKEARLNSLHVSQDSIQKLMQYYRFEYAKNTGIPDSVVELSYQYYMEHPKEMSEIYDSVIDTLGLKEQRLNSGGPRKIE